MEIMKDFDIYLDPYEVWDEVLEGWQNSDYTPYMCIAEDAEAGMQILAGYETHDQLVNLIMEICAQGKRKKEVVNLGKAKTKNECTELVAKIYLELFNYESPVAEIEEDDDVSPWADRYYEDDADLWQLREMEIDDVLEKAIETIAGMRSQDFMNSDDIAECKREIIEVVEMYCGLT